VTVIGIVLARPPIMAHLVSRSRPEVMSGLAGMVGEVGEVADAVAGHDLIGHLHLGGENWLSVSADGTVIEAGAKARIVGVDRTRLVLERVSGPAPPTAGP
jgi:membrane-bound ClpP family serine protease